MVSRSFAASRPPAGAPRSGARATGGTRCCGACGASAGWRALVARRGAFSTSNFAGRFIESDYTNNTAWVAFDLIRHNTGNSNGNPKIVIVGRSDCVMGSGLCGENAPNR